MKKIILSLCLVCSVLCLSSCFKVGHTEYIDILQLNVEEPDKVYKVGDTVKFTITGTLDTNLFDQYMVDISVWFSETEKSDPATVMRIDENKIRYSVQDGAELTKEAGFLTYNLKGIKVYDFNDSFEFDVEESGYYAILLYMDASDKNDWKIYYDGCKEYHFTVTE